MMTTMRLVAAERLEPKSAFRCADCDPPPKVPRVYRRYRFTTEGARGLRYVYCLPCAARLLGRSQGDLRRQADAQRAETGVRG
ncbi:MAG: hypothetical protein HY688_04865 [Chloroflexi bacterium]|nr:hypothetical protein [Chloroflexota bacterium]